VVKKHIKFQLLALFEPERDA